MRARRRRKFCPSTISVSRKMTRRGRAVAQTGRAQCGEYRRQPQGRRRRRCPPTKTSWRPLRRAIGDRPVLLASQHPSRRRRNHPARFYDILKAKFPGLLAIIVPRHAERGPGNRDAVRNARRGAPRAWRGARLRTPPIYIADTMGELGLVLSCRAIRFHGWQPRAAWRTKSARARAICNLRRAGGPAHGELRPCL